MKYLALTALIFLSGCEVTEGLSRWKGEYLCKEHGGVYRLNTFSGTALICKTGQRYKWDEVHSVILPIEDIGVENNDY